MNFLGDLFIGDGDEIVFFIIAFLFLFNGRRSEETRKNDGDTNDKSMPLFLIILFAMLLLSTTINHAPA